MNETKSTFIVKDGDTKTASTLSKLLAEKVNCTTDVNNYLGWRVIEVPSEKYHECLREGTKIVKATQLRSVSWINFYSEPMPIGFISICYCFLPKLRKGDQLWEYWNSSFLKPIRELRYCPPDIEKFFQGIEAYLYKQLFIRFSRGDNAFEILVEAEDTEHKEITAKCQKWISLLKDNPFRKIMYLKSDGELIQDKNIPVKYSGLSSYLEHSLFIKGLKYPCGSNISPKSDNDDESYLITGYKYSTSSWELRDFNITSEQKDNTCANLKGNFVAEIWKDYTYYWDADTKEQTRMEEHTPFTMIDSGEFVSSIEYDGTTICLTTDVSVVRSVVGYNFDGITLRDGLFGNTLHEDGRFNIQITEYFRLLSNGNVLHYSDYSDLYEIYTDTGSNFSLDKGLSDEDTSYPNVFNKSDVTDDEIANLLDLKK